MLVALIDPRGTMVASGLVARIAAEAAGLDAALLVLTAPGALADGRALASLLRERPAGPAIAIAEAVPGLSGVALRNVALAGGRAGGRDVLLLAEGTCPRPGLLTEMAAAAAYDPMIGFVGARSNDGDITNSPYYAAFRPPDAAAARAAHEAIEPRLPPVTFVPTLFATALLVRHAMLREFGLLDEAYGDGPDEHHDLIRRCNRCGYRAVLANRAYVTNPPSGGGGDAAARNGERLHTRYPEFHRVVGHYFAGAHYRAQAAMGGFVPDAWGRHRVLFDCGMLQPYHNGTFEHAVRLLRAFVEIVGDRYAVTVLADEEAFRFHGLDRVAGLAFHRDDLIGPRPYAIAFRLGQPFIREDILRLVERAPLTGFLMLDTIALDCQQISDSDLDALWRTMTDTADLIGYNSEASRAQFRRRFLLEPALHDFVTRCSTDVADYGGGQAADEVPGGGVLLVGNRYPHKHLVPAFAALRDRSPDTVVRILGIDTHYIDEAAAHALCDVPQAEATARYRAADAVLFPSHYEGFGLPLLHALANGTPVVARDIPSAREIAARTPLGANIHLAGDTRAMAALAADPPPWDPDPREPAQPTGTWHDAAAAVAAAFDRAIAGFDYDRCVAREARLQPMRGSFAAEEALGHATRLAADATARAEAAEARAATAERARDEARAAQARDQGL